MKPSLFKDITVSDSEGGLINLRDECVRCDSQIIGGDNGIYGAIVSGISEVKGVPISYLLIT